jgi:hypothetical protein
MGLAAITFHQAGNRSVERQSMPVIRLPEARSQIVTTGAAAVVSAQAAESLGPRSNELDGAFVTITAVTGNLLLSSGETPTIAIPAAGATFDGFALTEGSSVTFGVNIGDRIALIEWQ